ncbi:hypothetical protein [Gemmatimonas groenlandica]|uniref:Uncharacterized protein n=1 Tax=Gemmatimonas groenlandica TaxID=2732249 RepID=A0A6M4IXJ9_9BACT|nr:hypothetical protein [Gemmatimonas groenlandica]QJR37632.1 hypothetical protein HKW67_19965 [Gemmatimonas groenlandica]
MTWHNAGEAESLRVAARPDENGTAISVAIDRRGTLVATAAFAGMGTMLGILAGVGLDADVGALALGASLTGVARFAAVARGSWRSPRGGCANA